MDSTIRVMLFLCGNSCQAVMLNRPPQRGASRFAIKKLTDGMYDYKKIKEELYYLGAPDQCVSKSVGEQSITRSPSPKMITGLRYNYRSSPWGLLWRLS